jgi:hypothetical protein
MAGCYGETKESIEKAAKEVLDIRAKYSDSSLADLYDPLSMPTDLVKAHAKLDKEVEKTYTTKKLETEADMVAFLFSKHKECIEQKI